MTSDEQLALWVAGNSVHNKTRDECCPDFSCCSPELLAPEEERLLFRDRPELRDSMLMTFLARMLPTAYIAGEDRQNQA